jgi:ABC-type transport system involved in multi-copper enzyme maturation permease subunit
MFPTFFGFELRYWLRGFMVYVFTLILGVLVFAATQSDSIQIGAALENSFRNAPYNVQNFYAFMGLLSSLMVAAFVNSAATREFQYDTDQLLFTKPLSKLGFLLGRFLGSTLVAVLPLLGVSLGILLASCMPWNEPERWGPTVWPAHLWGILCFALPNTLLIGAIVFAIAVYTRSTIASFIGVLGLLVGYAVSQNLLADLDYQRIAGLLDPFGLRVFGLETRYWTPAERNTSYLTLTGDLLWNRLLWLAVSAAIFGIASYGFSFSSTRGRSRNRKEAGTKVREEQPASVAVLQPVTLQRGMSLWSKQFASQVRLDFWSILKSTVFIVVMVAGVLNMLPALFFNSGEGYGLSSLPVTYQVIDVIRGTMYSFLLGVIVFYAGVLVWKERDANLSDVLDATPQPTWLIYPAKFLSLLLVVLAIQALSMGCGMLVQASSSYFRLQPQLYLTELFVLDLLQLVALMTLAFFSHIISPNKYVGYFVFITLVIIDSFLWQWLEISTHLVNFGALPSYTYSDMYGYGPYRSALFAFGSYWLVFCGLLSLVNIMLWPRGRDRGVRPRLAEAGHRWQGGIRWASLAGLAVWLGLGGWIAYNTMYLNKLTSPPERENRQAAYERQFKTLEREPQPRIAEVKFEIDIFPEERGVEMRGTQRLENRTTQPIRQLYLNLAESWETTVEIEGCKLTEEHPELLFQIYTFDPPLNPGDSRQMKFVVRARSRGFENEVSIPQVAQNGTFFDNQIAPQIGYEAGRELTNRNDRRRQGLSEPRPVPPLDPANLAGRQNSYISNSSDWVDVETVISTSSDQVAVAPGSLQESWEKDGRRYFRYRLDQSSLNFYSFISARYKLARDRWNDVDIEVYYHPEHEWNVPRMLKSIRKSLEYYSQNFGPYRHKQARIIEFPRISSFAQAFPGTMPYSEGIGFIADIKSDDDIDMVFYVVAHEMAHQWWAHQVVGANMEGVTLLSETLAQYSALMLMEQEYGRDIMRKFLSYEMDEYLRSRGRELLKERPLLKVEPSQGYIHYRKGSVVMYQLKELIGEDRVNAALRNLVAKFGYQGPPYPTAVDLVEALKAETPPERQAIYHDLFEQVTLYGNRVLSARAKPLSDGKYELELEIDCRKYVADETGEEKEVPMLDELVELGAFAAPAPKRRYGETLYRQAVKVNSGVSTHRFIVDQLPAEVGVDPFRLLIDRVPDDNVRKPVLKESSTATEPVAAGTGPSASGGGLSGECRELPGWVAEVFSSH